MTAPATPPGWSCYLLGSDINVPPGVLEVPATVRSGSRPEGPPDRLWMVAGEVYLSDPDSGSSGVEPAAVYVLRILLPGLVAIYQVDLIDAARRAAGIPPGLPRAGDRSRVSFDGADITDAVSEVNLAPVDDRLLRARPDRPVTIDVADEAAALADVLDLPAGRERRSRERAVLAEEDRKAEAILREGTPDVSALEAERRRPVPPRPGAAGGRRQPSPPARLPGAPEFDPDLP